ncbi:MAG: hypothetical protein ACRDSQ_17880, partial [Actinokineospora sp.]
MSDENSSLIAHGHTVGSGQFVEGEKRMREFLDAARSFPAAPLGILLLVVVGYWLLASLGVVS